MTYFYILVLFFSLKVLQVDELKFEQPVYIDEVRVLPAGYTISSLEKSATRTG